MLRMTIIPDIQIYSTKLQYSVYVIQKKNNLYTLPVRMVVIRVIVMQGLAAVEKMNQDINKKKILPTSCIVQLIAATCLMTIVLVGVGLQPELFCHNRWL
jgi:hypothetical protein